MLNLRSGVTLFLASLSCTALSNAAFAQTTPSTTAKSISAVEKPARDFVMLQFTYEGWANKPDSIKTGGFGRGFNGYICYDFPIQKSSFSFAAGVGVGSANIYFDDQEIRLTDTGARGSAVAFVPETIDYKKYKINTTYLEAPFELRYFGQKNNRNKGFKAAIGMRAGILVGAHVKDSRTVDGVKVIDKVNTKRYLDKYRFSATARIGWGNMSVFGSYNLTSLYQEGAGPDVVPFSLGICLSGL